MTARPWFPFYTADYDRDTRDLDHEQHGIYFLLLKATWDQPTCSLPNDLSFIRRLLPRMHGHTFTRLVPPILARFFQRGDDGNYTSKRLTNERQTADKRSAKQRQNIEKRWKNNEPDHTSVIPSQSQSQSHKEESIVPAIAAPLKSSRRAKPRTALPPGWYPKGELSWWDQQQVEKFKLYHEARGSLMAKWDAAWGTWQRSSFYNQGRPAERWSAANNVVPLQKGHFVRDGSPERQAWDAYGSSRGEKYPSGMKSGGWLFPSQYPPTESADVSAVAKAADTAS